MILPCELCGSEPEVETRRQHPPWSRALGRWQFRFVCCDPHCAGHTGQWKGMDAWALRAWNASQVAKRSSIRRFIVTQELMGSGWEVP